MIFHEARMRRSELFGEADTGAHPAVEAWTTLLRLQENLSDDSESSEEVVSLPSRQELKQPSTRELLYKRLLAAGLLTKLSLSFVQDKTTERCVDPEKSDTPRTGRSSDDAQGTGK